MSHNMLLAPLVDQLIEAQIKIAGVVQGVGFMIYLLRKAKTVCIRFC